jgi:hypothetical protein
VPRSADAPRGIFCLRAVWGKPWSGGPKRGDERASQENLSRGITGAVRGL